MRLAHNGMYFLRRLVVVLVEKVTTKYAKNKQKKNLKFYPLSIALDRVCASRSLNHITRCALLRVQPIAPDNGSSTPLFLRPCCRSCCCLKPFW
uniref:Putative secreted protein n=1 Tax=Anopheles darlingi TaxID=43151 RepID=A0A2M4DI10_ANODA